MTISINYTEYIIFYYTSIFFSERIKCGKRLNLILTLLLVTQHFHPVLAPNGQTEKALLSTLAVISAGALYAFGKCRLLKNSAEKDKRNWEIKNVKRDRDYT